MMSLLKLSCVWNPSLNCLNTTQIAQFKKWANELKRPFFSEGTQPANGDGKDAHHHVTSHQGNTDRNHKEMPPRVCQGGLH